MSYALYVELRCDGPMCNRAIPAGRMTVADARLEGKCTGWKSRRTNDGLISDFCPDCARLENKSASQSS